MNDDDNGRKRGFKQPRKIQPTKLEDKADQAVQIFNLRKAGATFREIAEKLGYADQSGPYWVFKRLLKSQVKEAVDEVKQLELARLDELLLRLWPRQEDKGRVKLQVVDRILKLMERRAKLLGLDTVNIRTEGELTHKHEVHEVRRRITQDTESSMLFLDLAERITGDRWKTTETNAEAN
jgi:hypothetical protein